MISIRASPFRVAGGDPRLEGLSAPQQVTVHPKLGEAKSHHPVVEAGAPITWREKVDAIEAWPTPEADLRVARY